MLKVANSVIDASRIAGVLPVANGGTGVSTSTGTGNTVLSASPTFTGTSVFSAIAGGTGGTGYSLSGSAPANSLVLNSSGFLGIGTATPTEKLQVAWGSDIFQVINTSAGIKRLGSSYTGYLSGAIYAAVDLNASGSSGGDISFNVTPNSGSLTERMRLSRDGIVTMSAYGVGTATFSSAGVISSVSDETWKIKDGAPVNPDAMLNKLEPGYWYYNDEKKETFGTERQLGFYAQNVNAAIGPEAAPEPEKIVTKNDDGIETTVSKPWGYYDRSVLAVVVMSLQKALATIETLNARVAKLENKP